MPDTRWVLFVIVVCVINKDCEDKIYTLCGSGRSLQHRGAREEQVHIPITKLHTYSTSEKTKKRCRLQCMQYQISVRSRMKEKRQWSSGEDLVMDKFSEGFVPTQECEGQRLWSADWTIRNCYGCWPTNLRHRFAQTSKLHVFNIRGCTQQFGRTRCRKEN